MRPPSPRGDAGCDHSGLTPVLDALAGGDIGALGGVAGRLDTYLGHLQAVDPDTLGRDEALAYWIDLYNAAAIRLAYGAHREGHGSVLDVRRGFDAAAVEVAGEALSLSDVEHGKIRRFGDPRIHLALVCGSVSCPTLRSRPFTGEDLDAQLDDQARTFLAAGGAVVDRERRRVEVSRVFLWFGGDFTRPHRMPTWLPASKRRRSTVISRWLGPDDAAWVEQTRPRFAYQDYDWALACSVR